MLVEVLHWSFSGFLICRFSHGITVIVKKLPSNHSLPWRSEYGVCTLSLSHFAPITSKFERGVWRPVKHVAVLRTGKIDRNTQRRQTSRETFHLCICLHSEAETLSFIFDSRDDAQICKQVLWDSAQNRTRWARTIHKRTYYPRKSGTL